MTKLDEFNNLLNLAFENSEDEFMNLVWCRQKWILLAAPDKWKTRVCRGFSMQECWVWYQSSAILVLWEERATKTGKLTYTIFLGEKLRNENRDDVAGVAVIVIHIRDKLKLSVTQASTKYAQAFKTSLHMTSVDNVILPIHHVRFVRHQYARKL